MFSSRSNRSFTPGCGARVVSPCPPCPAAGCGFSPWGSALPWPKNAAAPANAGLPMVCVRAPASGWSRNARISTGVGCMWCALSTTRTDCGCTSSLNGQSMATTSHTLNGGNQKQKRR